MNKPIHTIEQQREHRESTLENAVTDPVSVEQKETAVDSIRSLWRPLSKDEESCFQLSCN